MPAILSLVSVHHHHHHPLLLLLNTMNDDKLRSHPF
jgi:hypothetical protein